MLIVHFLILTPLLVKQSQPYPKMMFKALAFSLLVAPSATANLLRTSRQLSEDKIAGYEPSSQVTDHNALDMDQNLMETYLSSSAFDVARSIYEKGGHSKSYAEVTVTSQGGLPYAIAKDERVRGFTSDGRAVAGTALDSYGKGSSTFGFLYFVSDDQSNHVGCMVGGLPLSDQKLDDCLVFNGTIEVANRSPSFVYEYNQQTHNKNDRTLKKFSTSAQELMFDCETCPYKTYEKFREYYGEFDYGDKWVTAAFGGVRTGFSKNGNMDFSNYGDDGKRGKSSELSASDDISYPSHMVFLFQLFRVNQERNCIHERLDVCDSGNGGRH
jgi:hypothetical protein